MNTEGEEPGRFHLWIARRYPRIWEKWWAARVLGSGGRALMIEGNKPARVWQREALTWAITLLFFALPRDANPIQLKLHAGPRPDDGEAKASPPR